MAIAIVAATVPIIAAACGRSRAASTAADVFDDEFDVRNCGCARHDGDRYSPYINFPDRPALTTCSLR